MNVTGINTPAKNPVSVSQNTQDSYEKDIQQQISRLQEKMEDVDSNTEMSSEQKANAKQKIQEQIQNLNKQLRQHQIEKQQKAAEQQKEAATGSSAEEENASVQPEESSVSGLSSVESGVMVTLSTTDQQMDHLRGIRTDLQGKLRTADSEEEKAILQQKINNISHHMGKAIKRSADTISDYRKLDQESGEKKQPQASNKSRQEQNVILKNKDGIVRMNSDRNQNDKIIYPSWEQNRNNKNHFYVQAQ